MPTLKAKSTSVQGGGKTGESCEEYLFIIQTIIDMNKKRKKTTKIVMTDVAKAFDQAWRIGVMYKLQENGIKGEILELIWKLNEDITARIREGNEYSGMFSVEESVRQGEGLSAILYGNHAGKVMEYMERVKIGNEIGRKLIPGVAWQDDIIILTNNEEDENRLINTLNKSTKHNRITLEPSKCKTITIGKAWSYRNAVIGGSELEDVEEGKILGHVFNNKNDNTKHIEEKENKTMEMMGALGKNIKDNNLDKMYMNSMIILYKKCMISKLLFGLSRELLGTPWTECV